MITFTLVSPSTSIGPGEDTIEVTIVSEDKSNVLVNTHEITLCVNDVAVDAEFTQTNSRTVTIQHTMRFIGPQELKLSVYTESTYDGDQEDHWIVNVTAEGTLREPDYLYSPFMSAITAYLPDYLKASADRYSVFQQLVNPIALELDRVRQSLVTNNKGLLLTAVNILDPDWLQEYPLGFGESFHYQLGPSGEIEVAPPSVWGIKDGNRIQLTHKSGFNSFWTEALPNRFEVVEIVNSSLGTLTPSTPLVEIAAIQPFTNPFEDRLYIQIHSSSNLFAVQSGVLISTLINIIGQNEQGADQIEEVAILRDGMTVTQKRWKRVDRLQIVASSTNVAGEIIVHAICPRLAPKTDTINKAMVRGTQESIVYKLADDVLGTCIGAFVSSGGGLSDLIKNEDTSQELVRSRLADVNGNYVTVTDFSMDPFSNRVYGVDATKLYIWDRRDRLPSNLSLLSKNSEDPELNFMLVQYNQQTVVDNAVYATVSVEMEPPQGVKLIGSWSWSVIKDDGTTIYLDIENNSISETPIVKENPIPISYYGIKERNFEIVLDEPGDYIFELAVTFMDGTEEVIRHPIQIFKKTALAEYELSHLFDLTDNINRVYILSDGQIVISNAEIIYSLRPIFDYFMVDVDGQRLLFREPYDKIEVRFDE